MLLLIMTELSAARQLHRLRIFDLRDQGNKESPIECIQAGLKIAKFSSKTSLARLMAVNMASAKPTDAKDVTPIAYNETAVRNNFNVLEYSRTCQSALTGIASGVLGLTGMYGFLFYLLGIVIQAGVWAVRSGARWDEFFVSRSLIFNHSFIGGLFTYVLLWVFAYGIVHVY